MDFCVVCIHTVKCLLIKKCIVKHIRPRNFWNLSRNVVAMLKQYIGVLEYTRTRQLIPTILMMNVQFASSIRGSQRQLKN